MGSALDHEFDRVVTGSNTHSQASSSRNNDRHAQLNRDVARGLFILRKVDHGCLLPTNSVQQQRALTSAEAALIIQKCAEAVQDERLTANEAVEQILDELAALRALSQVREALGRSVQPARPH